MEACLRDATLTPQTQSQEVVDHPSLRGTVCTLERDVHADRLISWYLREEQLQLLHKCFSWGE